MSSDKEDDDDDCCGGFFASPPDDADPLPSPDDIEAMGGGMGMMMRSFNSSSSSSGGSSSSSSSMTPAKVLSMIKSRRKAQQQTNSSSSSSSIMTIRMQLNGLQPPIWRRVKVPSSLTLHEFHNKVIIPAMGWAGEPSYHGYMFMLKPFVEYRNDKKRCQWGVGLGPVDCMTYKDTTFPQKAYGLSLCDTLQQDLLVGDLFYGETHNERRRKALYVYDLGDFFSHSLTLEDEQEMSTNEDNDHDGKRQESTRKFSFSPQLMDGERACPPEDCGGNINYAKMLSILANPPSHQEYQETLDKCHDSKNYNHLLLRNQQVFDPAKFDLALAQERVRLCFQSASKQRKWSSNEMKASCSCSLCMRQRREGSGEEDESSSSPSMQIAFMGMMNTMGCSAAARRQTQNLAIGKGEFFGKNEDGNRCCSFCLDRECPYAPQRFQKCINCRQRFYCSKQCQKEDWEFRHKHMCKEIAANHCCNCCGKIDKNRSFPCCSKCKVVFYCSRECQRRDWVKGRHRKTCQSTAS